MDKSYAAEIVSIEEVEDICSECGQQIYLVELKILSDYKQGKIKKELFCINKLCSESRKNMLPLH
jgi:hypothetical protein